jgi:predicted transcriptional regulator
MGCCATSAGTRSRAYARAKALGRNYSNVHADAQALTAAGLLDATDGGVRADYDVIETKIAIDGRPASSARRVPTGSAGSICLD